MKFKKTGLVVLIIFVLVFSGIGVFANEQVAIQKPENVKKALFWTKISKRFSVIIPPVYYNSKNATNYTVIADFYREKDEELAIEYYLKAADIYKQLSKTYESKYIKCLERSAELYYKIGYNYVRKDETREKSKQYFLNAIDIYKQISEKCESDFLEKFDESRMKDSIAMDSMEEKSKQYFEYYLNSMDKTGEIFEIMARNYQVIDKEECANFFLNSIQAYEKLVKINPQEYLQRIGENYNRLGRFYFWQKQYEKSKEYFIKARETRCEILTINPDWPMILDEDEALRWIIKINKKLKKHDEVEKNYLDKMKNFENFFEKHQKGKHVLDVAFYIELTGNTLGVANYYSKTGNYNNAEKYYFKALDRAEHLLDVDKEIRQPLYFNALNALGKFYFKIEKYEKAEEYFLLALEETYLLKEYHPNKFHFKNSQKIIKKNLDDMYTKLGKHKEAEKYK